MLWGEEIQLDKSSEKRKCSLENQTENYGAVFCN